MLSQKNSEIKKAFDILQIMSKDKEARALYLAREMALHDEATRLEEALERGKLEGIKQGKLEGIKQKSISIAKSLISIGLSEADIIMATGVSKEELDVIKKDMK